MQHIDGERVLANPLKWGTGEAHEDAGRAVLFPRATHSGAGKIVVWSDETAVSTVKAADQNAAASYSLSGVRSDKPAKGQLYIQNGKKYIAK